MDLFGVCHGALTEPLMLDLFEIFFLVNHFLGFKISLKADKLHCIINLNSSSYKILCNFADFPEITSVWMKDLIIERFFGRFKK